MMTLLGSYFQTGILKKLLNLWMKRKLCFEGLSNSNEIFLLISLFIFLDRDCNVNEQDSNPTAEANRRYPQAMQLD